MFANPEASSSMLRDTDDNVVLFTKGYTAYHIIVNRLRGGPGGDAESIRIHASNVQDASKFHGISALKLEVKVTELTNVFARKVVYALHGLSVYLASSPSEEGDHC